jgi:tetratricopeptide (TPR) repeat protein
VSLETRQQAATAYAQARVALFTADDAEDYERAVAHYEAAVNLRPGFARAHLELSHAAFAAGSPQRSVTLSISSADGIDKATLHLRRALELGLTNEVVLNNLGFNLLLDYLDAGESQSIAESIGYLEQALQGNEEYAVARYNLALARLLAGDPEGALRERERAIEPGALYEAAGALTDLEIAEAHRPDLATALRAAKDQIVGGVWGVNARMSSGSVSIVEEGTTAFANGLQVHMRYDELEAGDVVSLVWYFDDLARTGWQVVEDAFPGPVTFTPGSGDAYFLASVLAWSVPSRCMEPGHYRADFYLNGHLAASQAITAEVTVLRADPMLDLGVAACLPQEWIAADITLPGSLHGRTSESGDRGVYVSAEQSPYTLADTDTESNTAALDIFVETFSDLLLPAAPGVPGEPVREVPYFLGFSGAAEQYYFYEGGVAWGGAAVTREGVHLLALVFGPDAWWDTGEAYDVLASFTQYEN